VAIDSLQSIAQRASAALFMPVRKAAGPFHRRRSSLKESQLDRQRGLKRLSEPWGDDEQWYRSDFPPHQRNSLLPLIHGEDYFAELLEALHSAQERVTIAGWCLTPLMSLQRGDCRSTSILADVLRDVSARAKVYVLLWAGAPALFEPNLHYTKNVRDTLRELAPRVRCELDHRAAFSHDHHQKAVTVDGRVAFVGGMDLSTFQGDRWDTSKHQLRLGPNWHDVQMRLQGEVVHDVEENFCQRWNAVTGEALRPSAPAPLDPAWNTPAQIVRTVPEGFYPFAPEGEYGIRHSILTAIRTAERLVYLENQYIWAPEVVEALCDAMNRPHSGPFRIVLLLPARAYSGRYDNDHHVSLLREADAGRGIFEAYSPYAYGPAIGRTGYAYLPIYVHAKVGIVDDSWISVGSGNLNRRGLATDTEMNVQAIDEEVARQLRVKLWAEHLGMPGEEVEAADPIDLVDHQWKDVAARLGEAVRSNGIPPSGQIHRYEVGRTPTSRLLDFLQDLTLEH
jgi:phosphatidylserine/phosphatidylglycerophosphate/cardiolipin synthase-like enzyme